MNQKRCASKNLLTRNFTKTQKSEKRKIKIPPTMIRTSFFNSNYEGRHIENRKRKAKPKSQIPPTINSVTDSRYRITSAPLNIWEFLFFFSAGLPASGKSLIIFPPASPAGGKSLRSGGRRPTEPRSPPASRPATNHCKLINKLRLSGARLPAPPKPPLSTGVPAGDKSL